MASRRLRASLLALSALALLTAGCAPSPTAAPSPSPTSTTADAGGDDSACDAGCEAAAEALNLSTPRSGLSPLALTEREQLLVDFSRGTLGQTIDEAAVPDDQIIQAGRIICDELDDGSTPEGALIALSMGSTIASDYLADVTYNAVNVLCTEHLSAFTAG